MLDSYRDDHWPVHPRSKGIQGQMPEPGCEQACPCYPVQAQLRAHRTEGALERDELTPSKGFEKGRQKCGLMGKMQESIEEWAQGCQGSHWMVSFQVEPWLSVAGAVVPGDSYLSCFCCTPCLTCQAHGL